MKAERRDPVMVSLNSKRRLSGKDLITLGYGNDLSNLVKLLQISDISSSVTGNAINYPEELDTELFWKLYRINTNMSARGLTTTAPSDGGTDRGGKNPRYKNPFSRRSRR